MLNEPETHCEKDFQKKQKTAFVLKQIMKMLSSKLLFTIWWHLSQNLADFWKCASTQILYTAVNKEIRTKTNCMEVRAKKTDKIQKKTWKRTFQKNHHQYWCWYWFQTLWFLHNSNKNTEGRKTLQKKIRITIELKNTFKQEENLFWKENIDDAKKMAARSI